MLFVTLGTSILLSIIINRLIGRGYKKEDYAQTIIKNVSLFLFSFLCSWSSMVSQEPLADVIVELLGIRYCVYSVISIAGFIIS